MEGAGLIVYAWRGNSSGEAAAVWTALYPRHILRRRERLILRKRMMNSETHHTGKETA